VTILDECLIRAPAGVGGIEAMVQLFIYCIYRCAKSVAIGSPRIGLTRPDHHFRETV
jgi:hypothetical protein